MMFVFALEVKVVRSLNFALDVMEGFCFGCIANRVFAKVAVDILVHIGASQLFALFCLHS